MGATLRRALVLVVLASGLLVMPGSPADAQSCQPGAASDFDGDGVADIAIADPDATVAGHARAGRVHVVYGDGSGSQTISQVDGFVGGLPEGGDRFGFTLASVDWDGDGCDDLVVGTPFEAIGSEAEAGWADVLFGSPSGFGPNGRLRLSQDTAGVPGGVERGDRFGYDLAAGVTTGGEPFLVFGVPGEDVFGSDGVERPDAGSFVYVRGSTKVLVHQDSAGVFGGLEAGDLYGYAVAASARHVVVGGPGEAVEGAGYSGTVGVFTHDVAAGTTDGWDQVQSESGNPEASDWCGRSLAVTDYIPAGGSPGDRRSLVVVGCPGEALGEASSAGRLVTVDAAGAVTEVDSVGQEDVGVDDVGEIGDYFGWSVVVANRAPDSATTWQNLLVAAGVPGEEVDSRTDGGGVQVFSAVGATGDHDLWAALGEQGARLGQYLATTRTHLYVGDPLGATPAVRAIPWQDVLGGTTGGIRVYRPGLDGLPTDGVGTFGAAIV